MASLHLMKSMLIDQLVGEVMCGSLVRHGAIDMLRNI